jgi:anti-sigma factor RsiW
VQNVCNVSLSPASKHISHKGTERARVLLQGIKAESAGGMKSDPNPMKRYLLGRASPEERTGFENLYFADAGMFEELVAVENDLIDAYVRGRLSNLETQQFEKYYLTSPQHWTRVEFARTLAKITCEIPHSPAEEEVPFWRHLAVPPRLRWVLVASAVALVASGSWLVRQNQSLRGELQQARTTESDLRQRLATKNEDAVLGEKDQTAAGTKVAALEMPALREFTLALNPGMSRSNQTGQNVIAVPSSASTVRLQLNLDDDDHAAYEVVLETAEGHKIQSTGSLKSHVLSGRKAVIVRLPLRLIPTGDYVVRLNATNESQAGAEEIGVYSFRILRK